jgi:hypothetical protein
MRSDLYWQQAELKYYTEEDEPNMSEQEHALITTLAERDTEINKLKNTIKRLTELANRLKNDRNQKIPSGTNDPNYQWAKGHNDAQNYISGEIRKIIKESIEETP